MLRKLPASDHWREYLLNLVGRAKVQKKEVHKLLESCTFLEGIDDRFDLNLEVLPRLIIVGKYLMHTRIRRLSIGACLCGPRVWYQPEVARNTP